MVLARDRGRRVADVEDAAIDRIFGRYDTGTLADDLVAQMDALGHQRAPLSFLFVPAPINNGLWHVPFNRVDKLPEQLVEGREDVFFGYEFAIQGGNLPDDVVNYLRMLSNPDALRGPRSSSSSCSPASLPARSWPSNSSASG